MPPAATSPHPRTHPVCFAAPDLGTDPPPRPTSPSTRFAPTLCHSATWASPPPSDRAVLTPSRRAPCPAATSRHLLGSLPPATSPGSAAPVRASPVTGFRTSPSCTVHSTVTASARASGSLLRTTAVGSVCLLGTPRFTPSGSGANDDDTDRRRADLVRASVLNTLPRANVPTTARLVVGAAVHVRVVRAGFASSSLPVTPFIFTTLPTVTAMSCTAPVTTTAVNVSVMTIMARQLDRRARCTSKPSAAPLRDPTAAESAL